MFFQFVNSLLQTLLYTYFKIFSRLGKCGKKALISAVNAMTVSSVYLTFCTFPSTVQHIDNFIKMCYVFGSGSPVACPDMTKCDRYRYLHGLKAVLRIHDILVGIRIRNHGSMPLTNGSGLRSGYGSCYFRH
jgi:hypothetical protein